MDELTTAIKFVASNTPSPGPGGDVSNITSSASTGDISMIIVGIVALLIGAIAVWATVTYKKRVTAGAHLQSSNKFTIPFVAAFVAILLGLVLTVTGTVNVKAHADTSVLSCDEVVATVDSTTGEVTIPSSTLTNTSDHDYTFTTYSLDSVEGIDISAITWTVKLDDKQIFSGKADQSSILDESITLTAGSSHTLTVAQIGLTAESAKALADKTVATMTFISWLNNTVTLDANGGTAGTTTHVSAFYGSELPTIEKSALPTNESKVFTGYYDAKTGGTQYYKADGTSATTWDKYTDTTLYAQWAETYSGKLYLKDDSTSNPLQGVELTFEDALGNTTKSTTRADGSFSFPIEVGTIGTITGSYTSGTDTYSKVYVETSGSTDLQNLEVRKLTSLQVSVYQNTASGEALTTTYWCPAFDDGDLTKASVKFYDENGYEINGSVDNDASTYKMTDLVNTEGTTTATKMKAHYFAFTASNKTLNCYQTTDESYYYAFECNPVGQSGVVNNTTATNFDDSFWTVNGDARVKDSKGNTSYPGAVYWGDDATSWQTLSNIYLPTVNGVNYTTWYETYGTYNGGILSYDSGKVISAKHSTDNCAYNYDAASKSWVGNWPTSWKSALVLSQTFDSYKCTTGKVNLLDETGYSGTALSAATVSFDNGAGLTQSVETDTYGIFQLTDIPIGSVGTITVSKTSSSDTYSKADVITTSSTTYNDLQNIELRKLTSLAVKVYQYTDATNASLRTTYWCPAFWNDGKTTQSNIKFYDANGYVIDGTCDYGVDSPYQMSDLVDSSGTTTDTKMKAHYFAFTCENQTLNCAQTTDASYNDAFGSDIAASGVATKFQDSFWTVNSADRCQEVDGTTLKPTSMYWDGLIGSSWQMKDYYSPWPRVSGDTIDKGVEYLAMYNAYGGYEGKILSFDSGKILGTKAQTESNTYYFDAAENTGYDNTWHSEFDRTWATGVLLSKTFGSTNETVDVSYEAPASGQGEITTSGTLDNIPSGTTYTVNDKVVTLSNGATLTYVENGSAIYSFSNWLYSTDGGSSYSGLSSGDVGRINCDTVFKVNVLDSTTNYTGEVLLDELNGTYSKASNVVVTYTPSGGGTVVSATTDSEGKYTLTGVPVHSNGSVKIADAASQTSTSDEYARGTVYTSEKTDTVPTITTRKLSSLKVKINTRLQWGGQGLKETIWCPAISEGEGNGLSVEDIAFYDQDRNLITPASGYEYHMSDLYKYPGQWYNPTVKVSYFVFLKSGQSLNCYQTTRCSWNEAFGTSTTGTATCFDSSFGTKDGSARIQNYYTGDAITPNGVYWDSADSANWLPTSTGSTPTPTVNSVSCLAWYKAYGQGGRLNAGSPLTAANCWILSNVAVDADNCYYFDDLDGQWKSEARTETSRAVVVRYTFSN